MKNLFVILTIFLLVIYHFKETEEENNHPVSSLQIKIDTVIVDSISNKIEVADTLIVDKVNTDSIHKIEQKLNSENNNPFANFTQAEGLPNLYGTIEKQYFSKFSIKIPNLQIHKKKDLNHNKRQMLGLFVIPDGGDYLKKVWVDTIYDERDDRMYTRFYLENPEDKASNLKFLISSKEGLFKPGKLSKLITIGMLEEKPDEWLHEVPQKIDSAWINFENGNKYLVEYLTEIVFYDGGPYKRLKVIHDLTNQTESHKIIKILWAGDLDGDGKLDLIEDCMHEIGGAYEIYLHLSSEAEDGELIKTVAETSESAC